MRRNASTLGRLWMACGGLLLVGVAVLFVREIPSMRREWRLMRM